MSNEVDLIEEALKMKAEWEKLHREVAFRHMKIHKAMMDFDRELEELVNGTGNNPD
jgi:hypothetical protein